MKSLLEKEYKKCSGVFLVCCILEQGTGIFMVAVNLKFIANSC